MVRGYNDEKGNAIPVSLFNVRCQNDDGKDFSFPRYAEELAQFLNINSLDNFGQFNDKINKNSPLYYYSDSNQTPWLFVFKFEKGQKFVAIIGNKDTNLNNIITIQQNSLAPSTPSVKLDSQTTSQQTINIQLFTTANNSNRPLS